MSTALQYSALIPSYTHIQSGHRTMGHWKGNKSALCSCTEASGGTDTEEGCIYKKLEQQSAGTDV